MPDLSCVRGAAALAAGALVLSACSSSGATSPGIASAGVTATGSGVVAASPSPSPTPPAAITSVPSATFPPATAQATAPSVPLLSLAGCPPPRPVRASDVVARLGIDADDLAVQSTPAGVLLWVSAPGSGRVQALDASGGVVADIADPRLPEGIVPLPDGRLILAEQAGNRLVVLDPSTGAAHPFADLPGPGGENRGVDSIGFDAAGARLLVPDSSVGTLLAIPVGGGPAQTLASGLGRPVDAAADADGSVLVAVENSPGVVRVLPGGEVRAVAHLGSVDDVLPLRGLVIVADLGGHAIRALDPATGESRVLLSNVGQAQGLALRPDGVVLASDEANRTVLTVPACG